MTCSDDIDRLIWQQREEGWIGEDKIGRLKYKLLRDMATVQVRVMKAQDPGSDIWGGGEGLDSENTEDGI